MPTTQEVGNSLVDLCKQGKFRDAMEKHYSPKIVSIEPHAPPGKSPRSEGIDAVRGKIDWWEQNHEIHKCEVGGPWPHGDRFVVTFKLDVTAKGGPMAGKRFVMEEAGLYTVKDGKITQEEFFFAGM